MWTLQTKSETSMKKKCDKNGTFRFVVQTQSCGMITVLYNFTLPKNAAYLDNEHSLAKFAQTISYDITVARKQSNRLRGKINRSEESNL
jgi:hypothetical protein